MIRRIYLITVIMLILAMCTFGVTIQSQPTPGKLKAPYIALGLNFFDLLISPFTLDSGLTLDIFEGHFLLLHGAGNIYYPIIDYSGYSYEGGIGIAIAESAVSFYADTWSGYRAVIAVQTLTFEAGYHRRHYQWNDLYAGPLKDSSGFTDLSLAYFGFRYKIETSTMNYFVKVDISLLGLYGNYYESNTIEDRSDDTFDTDIINTKKFGFIARGKWFLFNVEAGYYNEFFFSFGMRLPISIVLVKQ